jgi:hypothetical protein
MLATLAAAMAITTGAPDWCAHAGGPGTPRNVEDPNVCGGPGVQVYWDRMSIVAGAATCENAAKDLTKSGPPNGPAQVGDGYWVETWGAGKPPIRCHIIKIDGKVITMAGMATTTGAPDWCGHPDASDIPRNAEDRNVCAVAGGASYWDSISIVAPATCENAAKQLTEHPPSDPAQVGDGYWVVGGWDFSKPIRCHIVRIEGNTIKMR